MRRLLSTLRCSHDGLVGAEDDTAGPGEGSGEVGPVGFGEALVGSTVRRFRTLFVTSLSWRGMRLLGAPSPSKFRS